MSKINVYAKITYEWDYTEIQKIYQSSVISKMEFHVVNYYFWKLRMIIPDGP